MSCRTPHIESFTGVVTTVWVLLSAFFSLGATILSLTNQLGRAGCAVLLISGLLGSVIAYRRLNGGFGRLRGVRLRRFRKPFPLLYLLCAIGALVGGALYAPSNHDALSYRVPRLLHWLAEGHWHWIGAADTRMDFAAYGSEALMLPAFATLHTLRFAFLGNLIPYLLMPGLVFTLFVSVGVRRASAAIWMWIIPCASCFVVQAGSIGNDLGSCVYLLAAMMFGFRAQRGHAPSLALAVVSTALMTGVKATNLPLLLPIAICLFPAIVGRRRAMATAILAALVSLPVSFLPTAALNTAYSGNWTGEADSVLRIKNPVVGLAGNSMLIGGACLAPALFPQAERVNDWFNSRTATSLHWIKRGFVDLRMTHPQLAAEEHSGLGLGVFGALLLALAGAWRSLRIRRLTGIGGTILAGFWIATFFYMIKLGNCGAPRYLASYYPGLIAAPLLLLNSSAVFRKRWWKWCGLVLLAPILPALAMNPARPLLPMKALTTWLVDRGIAPGISGRMKTVYDVYARRHDVYAPVREMLPPEAARIAFAGTSGDPSYSFWLPLGIRRVVDFRKTPQATMPDATGYDAIVASTWGTEDRFGMTPEELAAMLDFEVKGYTEVRALASQEPTPWFVLVPARNGNSHSR